MADAEMRSAGDQNPAGGGAVAFPPIPSDALIIIPVRNTVLFPGMMFPITIGRPKSIAAAQQAVREQRQIGIVMQRNADASDPSVTEIHRMGTVANVARYITAPDGTHHVVCQGEQRFQITEFLEGWPFLVARVLLISESNQLTSEVEARFVNLKTQAVEAVQLLPGAPPDLASAIQSIDSPALLTDLSVAYMDAAPEEKQEILETLDLPVRMQKASRLLAHRIEVLKLSRDIAQQTRTSLDERQREALLREQMATIQRQLGEGDDAKAAEMAELERAIAKANMPKEVEEQAKRELRRLQRMPEAGPEYGMIRTYLDWLTELPWAIPKRRRSISTRRAAFLMRITTIWKRSNGASSNIWRCANSRRRAARQSLFRGTAGRREDFAWPIHRTGDEPEIRARQSWRRA